MRPKVLGPGGMRGDWRRGEGATLTLQAVYGTCWSRDPPFILGSIRPLPSHPAGPRRGTRRGGGGGDGTVLRELRRGDGGREGTVLRLWVATELLRLGDGEEGSGTHRGPTCSGGRRSVVGSPRGGLGYIRRVCMRVHVCGCARARAHLTPRPL